MTRARVGSCADPKCLIGKVVARKGRTVGRNAMIGRTGVASHHWQSLVGDIKLIVLHVFVCEVEYFDVSIGKTLLYK